MLKLISLLLLLNSSASFANEEENFVCSAFYVKPLVAKVNAPNARDKFKHCSVSCMLTLRCGTLDAYSAGLLKELLDMMGMGNPETADIRANVAGITFAKKKEATNDEECMDLCGKLYP
ncbi:hypothetical protein C8D79_0246 [Bacteriovorax stolpii]|uniref:hypothetical protein n=1 Tax=Bacteriovorax stolpii TaxID=960 RepID=UPI00105E7F71|nr:hypothetical protein [Bacteriovorax stolpii]TDP55201.1 hypothetical protein C8D79_0246 [Bacteriovorax stolpii]